VNPPAATAVVCDTTAYLPAGLLSERDIRTISLYVSVDGDQQRESDVTDYDEFYERLRASESGATTSQPSIGDFLEVYEPLLGEGREVVSIHISAGISGTFEAAGQARERLIEEGKGGERLYLMDSRSAAGGMGLCALGAAAAAAAGADADGALAGAEQTRNEEVGPVLGAHVGPGLLGVGSVPTDLI
jgi:DegV family protein with EDD domain